jgi:hypothetical protein
MPSRAILRSSKGKVPEQEDGGHMRLGDYIDDYCTRCKLSTDHSIVSMVGDDVKKVRCRTCDSEHNYKHNKGSREMTAQQAYEKVLASVMGAQSAPSELPRPKSRSRKKS